MCEVHWRHKAYLTKSGKGCCGGITIRRKVPLTLSFERQQDVSWRSILGRESRMSKAWFVRGHWKHLPEWFQWTWGNGGLIKWNDTWVGRWGSRDTLQKDCSWNEYKERIGNWKGKSSCKWVYQNVISPNSEMEQEAVVMHQKTADGRRENIRALLKRNMWAWGAHIPLS